MDHPECEFIKGVLEEPLKNALSSIVLYQPSDPINFLANYLKYWAEKVRDHRCRQLAVLEFQKLLEKELPFNIRLQASRAIVTEQNHLKSERMRVEEEERRRLAELQRQREMVENLGNEATAGVSAHVAPIILDEVVDMATDLALKAWRRQEKARLKAEKARRAAERLEGEDMSEDEEEEDEDADDD